MKHILDQLLMIAKVRSHMFQKKIFFKQYKKLDLKAAAAATTLEIVRIQCRWQMFTDTSAQQHSVAYKYTSFDFSFISFLFFLCLPAFRARSVSHINALYIYEGICIGYIQ